MAAAWASKTPAQLGGAGPGGGAEGQEGERREDEARTDHRSPFFAIEGLGAGLPTAAVTTPTGRHAERPRAARDDAVRGSQNTRLGDVIPLRAIFKLLDVRRDLERGRAFDLLALHQLFAGSR